MAQYGKTDPPRFLRGAIFLFFKVVEEKKFVLNPFPFFSDQMNILPLLEDLALFENFPPHQTVSLFLPFWRRRQRTFLPPGEEIRRRKPWVRFLLILEG